MAVPSVTFARKNNNCTPAETVERAATVAAAANAAGMRVRGYVSCALGCPFEGAMEPAAVADLAEGLQAAGCHEVCLADTIGTGAAPHPALLLPLPPASASPPLPSASPPGTWRRMGGRSTAAPLPRRHAREHARPPARGASSRPFRPARGALP